MGFEILELEEIILKNVADRRRMRQLYCLHKYIDRSSLSLQFLTNKLSQMRWVIAVQLPLAFLACGAEHVIIVIIR